MSVIYEIKYAVFSDVIKYAVFSDVFNILFESIFKIF